MFEIFIALFGGLFYGTGLLFDKSDKFAADTRWNKYLAIRNIVYDPQKALQIEREFRSNRNVIIEELRSELEYIIGDDYLERYKLCRFFSTNTTSRYSFDSLIASDGNSIDNIWNLAHMVYLAKNGYAKFSWFYTTKLIEGLYGDINYHLTEEELREQRKVSLRFGEVLEYYLSRKLPGGEMTLYFDRHYSSNMEILVFGYYLDSYPHPKRRPLLSHTKR